MPYLCLGVLTMGIYLATMAPSLVWDHWGTDGGDLITAAVTGRISHPPGSPTYYFLARVFVHIFGGDPARALNVLSGAMATGATLCIAGALRRRGIPWLQTGAIAATFAFSPWLWSQAVITEVYTTAAFFGGLVLYLSAPASSPVRAKALITGLVLGLGVSVHVTTALLAVYIMLTYDKQRMTVLLGLLLGLLPYVLLRFCGRWPQPWGDLRSLAEWWTYVSARIYWGNVLALPVHRWPQRLLAWAVLLIRQFTPFGMALALAGIVRLWSTHRCRVVGMALALMGISVYAIGYHAADSWVYLLAYLPLLALALAEGVQWAVAHRLPPLLVWLMPLALLFLNWQGLDLHANRDAEVWLHTTLADLPPRALVVTEQDQHTFSLWYAVDARGTRRDLLIVDRRLWESSAYQAFLSEGTTVSEDEPEDWARGRPICHINLAGEVSCL